MRCTMSEPMREWKQKEGHRMKNLPRFRHILFKDKFTRFALIGSIMHRSKNYDICSMNTSQKHLKEQIFTDNSSQEFQDQDSNWEFIHTAIFCEIMRCPPRKSIQHYVAINSIVLHRVLQFNICRAPNEVNNQLSSIILLWWS